MTGREIAIKTATTVSTIQSTQANVIDQLPQDGTHINTQSWIKVANPIGNVPRNNALSDCGICK